MQAIQVKRRHYGLSAGITYIVQALRHTSAGISPRAEVNVKQRMHKKRGTRQICWAGTRQCGAWIERRLPILCPSKNW